MILLKNRFWLTVVIIFITLNSYATDYFVSATGNDANNGTSTSTPWRNVSKVNSFPFAPGDHIFFRRGDTWHEELKITRAGIVGTPIVYGAYGSGAQPIINGFSSVAAWTNLGSNIWESTSAVSTLPYTNVVVINGVNTPMGRTPNSGYSTYQSTVGTTSITSSSLSGTPNWTGAEVVIKKDRYIIDRNPITAQSGGTLTYTASSTYPGKPNWGFFIQNDVRTLDAQDEWYYNPSTKKLRIYSTSSPVNVQVATIDTLVYIFNKSNITFDNISFTGANKIGINIYLAAHVTVQNCSFDFCNNGIKGERIGTSNGSTLCVITANTMNHTQNNAINLPDEFTSATITSNLIKNSGMLVGMSASADGAAQGMNISGASSTIQYNEVDSSGYNGIGYQGNSTSVKNNFINNFCIVKDDGGGIYSGNDHTNCPIQFNTVINGIGNGEGVNLPGSSRAYGLYIDGNSSSGFSLLNNNVGNIGYAGIYLHNPHDIILRDNTVYNSGYAGLLINNDQSGTTIANLTLKNNIFFSKASTELTAEFKTVHAITGFGTLDSNYYPRPIDDNITINTVLSGVGTFRTLNGWKSFSGYDAISNKSPITISDVNDLRFEYNETGVSKIISLPFNYIDVKSVSYNGTITLAPYKSAVLIKNGPITGNIPPTANAGVDQTITLPTSAVTLSGSGTDSDGTVVAYNWTKVSGPACTITSPSSASTTVTGMSAGVYVFQLKTTDDDGAQTTDNMQVTVNAAGNVLPTSNAGVDKSITLPVNSVSVAGSGTDSDGFVSAYAWNKVSGPGGDAIINSTSATTSITFINSGVYLYRLKVTDNSGGFVYDTMQVTVNANPVPVANAGSDQTITLPTNSVSLSGSGTDDISIVTYHWTKISGAGGTITNPNSQNTTFTGLGAGLYDLQLQVTDNGGATDTDDMIITVNAAANIPPVANAGTDQNIQLPINTVNLTGIGTDADGTITTYSWLQLSGPSSTIVSPSATNTAIEDMDAAGVYSYKFGVTDNDGAARYDTIFITVIPADNISPVANAGTDKSIMLPVSFTTLDGSASSDADGTITYAWVKTSGPSCSITSPASAITGITGMIVNGTYNFTLTITDNDGAVSTDNVTVVVSLEVLPVAPTNIWIYKNKKYYKEAR